MTQKRKANNNNTKEARAAKKRMTTEKRSIKDLPMELFYIIVSFVTQPDLVTLCQLRLFRVAAQAALYAHISTCNTDIIKLLNTMLRTQELRSLVTSLNVSFPYSHVSWESIIVPYQDILAHGGIPKQSMEEWMQQIKFGSFESIAVILMALLPNLRTVSIHSTYDIYEYFPTSVPSWFRAVLPVRRMKDTLVDTSVFQTPFLNNVQSLTIKGFGAISLNSIAAFFALPALVSLKLSRVRDSRQDFPSSAFKAGLSNISDLTFESASLSTRCLCHIINGTRRLKRFVYTTAQQMDNLAIVSALLKDRTTLEVLELPRLSSSPIIASLVQFSKLETLSINAAAVFGDSLRAPKFPVNVKNIKITDTQPLVSSRSNMDCMRKLLSETKPLHSTVSVHCDSMNYDLSESDSEEDSVRLLINDCGWTEEEDSESEEEVDSEPEEEDDSGPEEEDDEVLITCVLPII